MKKVLICLFTVVILGIFNTVLAQEECGKFKFEGYTEYINFNNDIDMEAWGGGVLARYMLLHWLGGQTSFTIYDDSHAENFGDNLSVMNWRASVILHTTLSEILENLYAYAGGGVGMQFNDDIGKIQIDDAVTTHVLLGIGYDITNVFSIEAEFGGQFGHADVRNYSEPDVNLEAVFIRLGAGLKF